eukprot:264494_1
MGNVPDVSKIKRRVSNTLHINNQSSKPKRKLKPCKCALYTQTRNHCCYQMCLHDTDQYSHLTKVWLFTDEHIYYLDEFLTRLNLQDVTVIITEFLSGIDSTLEEYSVFY